MNERVAFTYGELPLTKGQTPAHSAIFFNGDPQVLELLLELKADIHSRNATGHTLLAYAASADRLECLQLLVSGGLDINARGDAGDQPIHAACLEGRPRAISLLLDLGVDVNTKASMLGWTPLVMTVLAGRTECAELLLSRGADPSLITGDFPWGARLFFRMLKPLLSTKGPLHTLLTTGNTSPEALAKKLGNFDIAEMIAAALKEKEQRSHALSVSV